VELGLSGIATRWFVGIPNACAREWAAADWVDCDRLGREIHARGRPRRIALDVERERTRAIGGRDSGQFAGAQISSPVPKKVPIPKVVPAGGGRNNAVSVLADGTVRVWGRNDSSTMGNGQNV